MATPPPAQRTALEAYLMAQTNARILLFQIERYLEQHQTILIPEDINWNHVSDITHVIAALQNVPR